MIVLSTQNNSGTICRLRDAYVSELAFSRVCEPVLEATPISPNRAKENESLSLLFDFTSNLLKMSGAIALFGYISLRARMNRLGVSAPDVPVDRYLMEAYNVLASVLFTAGMLLVRIGALALFLFLAILAIRGRWKAAASNRVRIWTAHIPDRLYLAAAFLLLGSLEYWIPATLNGLPTDVLVRPLGAGALAQPVTFPAFLLVLFLYVLAAAVCWVTPAVGSLNFWWLLRKFTLILVILVGLQLPLLYGFAVQNYLAPVVSVKPKAAPERTCGLLVADTNNLVTVWVPSKHRLLQFVRSELEGASLGRVLALVDALRASEKAGVLSPSDLDTECAHLAW
jgi:hypothetical protein